MAPEGTVFVDRIPVETDLLHVNISPTVAYNFSYRAISSWCKHNSSWAAHCFPPYCIDFCVLPCGLCFCTFTVFMLTCYWFMFSLTIDILCLFWWVLECVWRILPTVSIELSIHQSRLLLPHWLKQNVTPCLGGSTNVNKISRMWKKHIDITFKSHRCAILCSDWNLQVNNLNAELKPICHPLALLGAHSILHVSKIRVKNETKR